MSRAGKAGLSVLATILVALGAYALGSLGHIGTPHHALHVMVGTLGGLAIVWAIVLVVAAADGSV